MSTLIAKPNRVASIGASGTYGKGILARAEEISIEAVVITRSPHKFKGAKPTTTVVVAELNEEEKLKGAFLVRDGVISARGSANMLTAPYGGEDAQNIPIKEFTVHFRMAVVHEDNLHFALRDVESLQNLPNRGFWSVLLDLHLETPVSERRKQLHLDVHARVQTANETSSDSDR